MKLLLLIPFLLCLPLAHAATITGTVYSIDLEAQNDSIVTVNSTPEQIIVAQSGAYSFEVGPGSYHVTAQYLRYDEIIEDTSENITIAGDGVYHIDLILFPNLQEEFELLNQTQETFDDGETEASSNIALWLVLLIAAGIGAVAYLARRMRKPAAPVATGLSNDAQTILSFINQEGGKTTQKEVRKQFPQSEAKISLTLTELEHSNHIKKIKKGRGNIIIRL